MSDNLSHRPEGLYRASIERMESAHAALARDDYVLAVYLAGLAVESILQAWALRSGAAHDAGHHLPSWLTKCPPALRDQMKAPPLRDDWSELAAIWENSLRYLSKDGLLGYLRQRHCFEHFKKGDSVAKMKAYCRRFVNLAQKVQAKGIGPWRH